MFNIRRASKKDKNVIAHLMVLASGGICEFLLDNMIQRLSAENVLALEVAKDHSSLSYKNCVLAEYEGQVVGVLCFYDVSLFTKQVDDARNIKIQMIKDFYHINIKNAIYIDTLAVKSEYQNKKIGLKLFKSLSQFIDDDNVQLILYVWNKNTRAIQFYQKFGFEKHSEISINTEDFPIKDKRLLMCSQLSNFKEAVKNMHD